jgi:enoyl-CoA hydratase/carnithine racemase
MALNLDPRTFREMLDDPALAEIISAMADFPLIRVEVADATEARWLDGLDITAVPAVVLAVAPDSGCLSEGAVNAADVILTEDATAPSWFTAPSGGLAAAVAQLEDSVTSHPVAATALALVLRSSAGRSVPACLVAESATYSALQAGAEFLSWRAAHEPRPPEPGDTRVVVDQSPGELQITLARPARRNAVDWHMRDALVSALVTAVNEEGLRVVLRGEGPDFCAGGDLDEFGSRPDPALAHLIRVARSPALLMNRLASRTTVHLHGSCLGAGIELPAFARTVYATPDTRIGLPEIGLGLIPGAGGTASLPQRIGRWRTAFLALTGVTISTDQALQWGLIDAVKDEPTVSGRTPL